MQSVRVAIDVAIDETGRLLLADGQIIAGHFDLSGTKLAALPQNLSISGSLDLTGTGISDLPKRLTIGGNLFIRGTNVRSIPDGVRVGGGVFGLTLYPTRRPRSLTTRV